MGLQAKISTFTENCSASILALTEWIKEAREESVLWRRHCTAN